MNVSGESVKVLIGGTEYALKTDTDGETTRSIAAIVNTKMEELKRITATNDTVKLAIITALNIAEELQDYKRKYETIQGRLKELESRAFFLSSKIDSSIGRDNIFAP